MTSTVSTVAIYLRISSDPLGLRVGVERQWEDCQKVAEVWYPKARIVKYEDNDTSAWSGAPRPEYDAMCEAIHQRRVQAVIAYNQDRLLRLPRELERFIDLCADASLTNVHTVSGDIDLTSDDGQLKARIMAAVAKKSSDDTSRRVRRALRARDEKGLYHGGRTPFWATNDAGVLSPLPGATTALTAALHGIVAGRSLGSVYRDYPSPKPTSIQQFRAGLLSPHLIGYTKQGNKAQWEPVVDHDLWETATLILTDPRRDQSHTHPGAKLQRWLTGLMYCHCGARMGTQVHNTGARRYLCRECWTGIDALFVEDHIRAYLFEVVELEIDDTPPEDTHAEERRFIEAKLAHLARDYANDLITRDEWLVARNTLQARIPQSPPIVRIPSSLSDVWEDMDPAQKQSLAQQVLERIIVRPADRATRLSSARLVPVRRPT